jgi:hypothetical protein
MGSTPLVRRLSRGFVRIRQSGFLANTCVGSPSVGLARALFAAPKSTGAALGRSSRDTDPPDVGMSRYGPAMIVGQILSTFSLAAVLLGFDNS